MKSPSHTKKHDYSEAFAHTQNNLCTPLQWSTKKPHWQYMCESLIVEAISKIDFDYNLSYFDAETIEQMVTHFQKLFNDALENLDKQIFEFSLLSTEARQRFLQKSLISVNPSLTSETLITAFEKIASKYPQHSAVKFENVTLTYTELNQKSKSSCSLLTVAGHQARNTSGFMLGTLGKHGCCYTGSLKNWWCLCSPRP